jgi:hypothetical protein
LRKRRRFSASAGRGNSDGLIEVPVRGNGLRGVLDIRPYLIERVGTNKLGAPAASAQKELLVVLDIPSRLIEAPVGSDGLLEVLHIRHF